ncbi:MFS transporter [Falsihalocynthiibacter sp. SS001]|uniref:MFS transporter n=1 Tax=Falsihalocynthiibacter sp. SS001 TaxID=3349698 RepID=UPI0036D2CFF7
MTRSVLLLTAIVGVVGSNSLMLSPIAAKVAVSLGASSPDAVMTAAALYGLGVAMAALLLAPLADRFGAARSLRAALVLLVLALILSTSATSVAMLSAAHAIAGIAAGVAIPALYSLAAQIAPKGQEARVIGTVLSGWTLSMVGGVTISAYVADIFGWRYVYGGLAAAVLVTLPMLARMDLPTQIMSKTSTSPITALRVDGIIPALMAVAALGFGFYGFYNYLGAHLEVNLNRPVRDAGVLTLVYGIGFAAAMVFDGVLDRLPTVRGLAGIFGLLAVLYVGIAWATNSYLWLLVLAPIWGILQHLGLNLTVGWLTRLDPAQRGAIMGLNSAVMYLSVFSSTLLYRFGFTHFGMATCALFSAGLSAVAVIYVLQTRRSAQPVQTIV